MEIIYQNTSLQYIIDAITNGTVGILTDNDDYENYMIINKTISIFSGIVIKPIIINIANNVIFETDIFKDVELAETEFLDFIVYSAAIETENESENETDSENNVKQKSHKILVNQSLIESIIMFELNNINLLKSTGWYLIKII